jgi:hypothetical protein
MGRFEGLAFKEPEMNRRSFTLAAASGFIAMVSGINTSAHGCFGRRKRNHYVTISPTCQYVRYLYDDEPVFQEYMGNYSNILYGDCKDSFFAFKANGKTFSPQYLQMVRTQVVPDLANRQVSLELNKWHVIPDSLNKRVTVGEVRTARPANNPIFIDAWAGINTGPGPKYPLILDRGDGAVSYGDGEPYFSFWDHLIRFRVDQTGGDSGSLKIKMECYNTNSCGGCP